MGIRKNGDAFPEIDKFESNSKHFPTSFWKVLDILLCKFFAIKWEFAKMGTFFRISCYFWAKWVPILSRRYCSASWLLSQWGRKFVIKPIIFSSSQGFKMIGMDGRSRSWQERLCNPVWKWATKYTFCTWFPTVWDNFTLMFRWSCFGVVKGGNAPQSV